MSQIPGRSEPDDRAEIVTQILFGESFIVLKKNKKWSYVQLTYDNYK
ncbi:MAG: SH3 domain-containing protein, partial [Bacteroidetes bacterium]